MRILMLTWEYPPRIVGGISRHVQGLAEQLASKEDCEVHVVTLDFPGTPAHERIGSLHIHRVTVEVPASSFHTWVLLFNQFFEKKIGQIAQEYGPPDAVHVHDWLTVTSGISTKYFLNCPMIMTFHSTEAMRSGGSTSPESNLVGGLERGGGAEAERVITISKWMHETLGRDLSIPEEKIVIIPNGVDLSKFENSEDRERVRASLHVSPTEKLIMSVGRLTPQKGFDDLVRAFPKILRNFPTSRLLLIGEGHQRGELEELARREGVADKTIFAGFIKDEGLVPTLKASDIIVIPSKFEPFGITALEAMAAGVPVVVSRVGGLTEIVDNGLNGLLVEPGNPSSIAQGVIELASNHEMASRIAEGAKEKVKKYNWSSIAEETLEVYRRAIDNETKRP